MNDNDPRDIDWAPLVPEFVVSDIAASRRFYTEGLGFMVLFDRPEEGFAYLNLDRVQIMLVQNRDDLTVVKILGPQTPPFGVGSHLQIAAPDVDAMVDRLAERGHAILKGPTDVWRRVRDLECGQREIWLRDPDGYLLRFHADLGYRSPGDEIAEI
ncbi:MAG: VOC family protein [Alphaproteobacteria bacterium]|nr:VOC family protein [Alphaproteobacteria bacterium]